jgi:hypothetical protein
MNLWADASRHASFNENKGVLSQLLARCISERVVSQDEVAGGVVRFTDSRSIQIHSGI